MDDIFVRGISLPGKVRGITIVDDSGNYNVYINTNLCPEAQHQAIAHEFHHIRANHFYDDFPAVFNELELNG